MPQTNPVRFPVVCMGCSISVLIFEKSASYRRQTELINCYNSTKKLAASTHFVSQNGWLTVKNELIWRNRSLFSVCKARWLANGYFNKKTRYVSLSNHFG